jgi:hypothetical protein
MRPAELHSAVEENGTSVNYVEQPVEKRLGAQAGGLCSCGSRLKH